MNTANTTNNIRATVKSPVIVQSNADYKRPASIQPSARSFASERYEKEPLPRSWTVTLFLSLHVLIAIVRKYGNQEILILIIILLVVIGHGQFFQYNLPCSMAGIRSWDPR